MNHRSDFAGTQRGGRKARFGIGFGVLLAAGLGLGAFSEAEAGPDPISIEARETFAAQQADGEKIFNTYCSSCHQASGEGVPGMFPPLAGSEWVNGDEETLIKIILQGVTGEMEVAGQFYAGMMPPWGQSLKDDEIAALTTYLRSAWGNEAPAVEAATVAKVRKATSSRKTPWTAAELEQ